MICEHCGQPLTEIDLNGHLVAMCLNWECPLYRQHKVIRAKVVVKELKKRKSRKLSPCYRRWLKQRRPKRRERYNAIRKLGIDTKEALRLRDMTSMTIKEIEESKVLV